MAVAQKIFIVLWIGLHRIFHMSLLEVEISIPLKLATSKSFIHRIEAASRYYLWQARLTFAKPEQMWILNDLLRTMASNVDS